MWQNVSPLETLVQSGFLLFFCVFAVSSSLNIKVQVCQEYTGMIVICSIPFLKKSCLSYNTVCQTKLCILILLHIFEMPPKTGQILESPLQPVHFVCLFVFLYCILNIYLCLLGFRGLKGFIEVLGDQNDCALQNEQLALALSIGTKIRM